MSPATPCFLVPFGAILFFRVRPRFVHHATRGRRLVLPMTPKPASIGKAADLRYTYDTWYYTY